MKQLLNRYIYVTRLCVLWVLTACLCVMPVGAASVETTITNIDAGIRGSALGCLAADAVREQTGADIAVLTADMFAEYLPPGELTQESLAQSIPINGQIVLVQLPKNEFLAMLEQSVSHICIGSDERINDAASYYEGFLQISGFSMEYDATAPVGERILRVALEDGTSLEALPESLSIAMPLDMLNGAWGYTFSARTIGASTVQPRLWTLLEDYLEQNAIEQEPESDRVTALGAHENLLVESGSFMALLVILLVGACVALPAIRRSQRDGDDFGENKRTLQRLQRKRAARLFNNNKEDNR